MFLSRHFEMALSESSNCNSKIGWKKWLIFAWAFLECVMFAGLLLGWGSLVFVLKDEGIYADLCRFSVVASTNGNTTTASTDGNTTTASTNGNTTTAATTDLFSKWDNITVATKATPGSDLEAQDSENITDATSGKQCISQDEHLVLCFTIASAIFCLGGAVLGQIHFKFGTRVTRVIGL